MESLFYKIAAEKQQPYLKETPAQINRETFKSTFLQNTSG